VVLEERVRGLILAALLTSGCVWDAPFALTTADELTEEQMWLTALIGRECQTLGVEPVVRFTDDAYVLKSPVTGAPAQAAMWAETSKNQIVVWNGVFEYSESVLVAYARHECAHLYLGHKTESLEVEEEAERCVREWPTC